MKIITSKKKSTVQKWAKQNNRKVLWLDTDGVWHAAIDRNNTPARAVKTEDLP